MRLTHLLNEYVWPRKWSKNVSGRESMRNASRMAALMGDPHVSKVTCPMLDKAAQSLLAEGLTGATVNRHMAAISYALKVAWRIGEISSVPPMPEMQPERARERCLSRAEVDELCSHITSQRVCDLIRFLYDTGMRVTEALNLRWEDIDGNHATVRTLKGGAPRIVPLTKTALGTLRREDPVRVWTVSQDSLNWNFKTARERSITMRGQEDVVPHALRHSAASRLVAAGADVAMVKEFLGHRNITTTMRYVHLNKERLAKAATLLEKS